MTQDVSHLFEIEVDKDELWNLYLDSFPEGTNEIYRERREYDCSCCRHFVKAIGSAVTIRNNKITTIWDFDAKSDTFQPVIDVLANYVRSKAVTNVYVSKFSRIGIDSNFEQLDNSKVAEWNHLNLDLPKALVDKSSRSEGDIKGSYRDIRNVFKRSLDELTEDSILTVLELINSNTLYKGEEWKNQLGLFLKYKVDYGKLQTNEEKELYAWEQSLKAGAAIGKIKNHSIGTLLTNISEGMDLDVAVKKYEAIIAPANYKRPKAIFTQKMLEEAKKTIQELGYMDSLSRRYSKLDDITVNNILFTNKDSAKRIAGADIFDEMKTEIAVDPKKFSKIEEISINDFIQNVIPTSKEIEVLLENKHANNMVSLIAPGVPDSQTMFKWSNNFSWAYSGNMTDSPLAQQVRSAGGRTDGVLRFSNSWNHEGKRNESLMDFHVFFPNSSQSISKNNNGIEIHDNYGNDNRVGWNNRKNNATGGSQDVDYTPQAPMGYIPVENITFPAIEKMPEGVYTFKAHNWDFRNSANGFKSEIAFGSDVLEFDYDKSLRHKEWVTLAKIELKNGIWNVLESMGTTTAIKDVWGLKTQQFVPVSTIMFSPNYWDEQQGIGHKHCFFMLKDCINLESPNGFYNEFLKEDLMKHKRVFEALGGKMRVADVDDQLSGVGFSLTKRNEVLVKVIGKTERIMKIKF